MVERKYITITKTNKTTSGTEVYGNLSTAEPSSAGRRSIRCRNLRDKKGCDNIATYGTIMNNGMTQDERWNTRYEEVKSFIEGNKRNPSKYVAEERLMVHFLKRGRKMLNAGELTEPRYSQFLELLELCEKYKHVNQYV